jgi:thiamine-phosphate pyrophosphorylase
LPLDYVAFGPIFPTSTKENPDPVRGLAALAEVATIKHLLPLVAIGGISHKNALETLRAGADSVAVIGELVANRTQIAENMSKMLTLTSRLPNG